MSRIRNKVAHQATFFHAELKKGIELSAELTRIIQEAEKHIDEIVLSLKEKQAIHQAAAEVVNKEEEEAAAQVERQSMPSNPSREGVGDNSVGSGVSLKSESDNRVKLSGPKILGKIKLEQKTNAYKGTAAPGYRVITEEEICQELEEAQNLNYTDYVGLKWFVTTYLANKGYAIGTTYSLVNILIEKTKIELYDMESPEGYSIKAVRMPK
ncbi:MAG: hypothetical protein AAF828_08795 [Bacteroidota bacterium]